MIRRGTFIHHHIPYGRAYYSGTWTTLLTAADLAIIGIEINAPELVDRAPSSDVDTNLTCRAGAASTGTARYPQTTTSGG